MDKNKIKEKFIRRLYRELQEFKQSILERDKQTVYGESYKIEVVSTLYEIFLEKADTISDTVLLNLTRQSAGILETVYEDWLKKEDSSYQELREHVESELEQGCFWMDDAQY